MSAQPTLGPPATTLRVPARGRAGSRGSLRLVPQRHSSAARAPFVAVVVALLAVGLLGLLLLNTVVAQNSFRLAELRTRGLALELQEQDLTGQVQLLQAPASLARRATELGMVPGGPPAFLRLPDGKVLGKPRAGQAPPPAPAPTAPASTASAPAAKAAAPAGSLATAPATAPATGKAVKGGTGKAAHRTATTRPVAGAPTRTRPARTTATGGAR